MSAPAKSTPKDAQVMTAILKDMGVAESEPRIINQMLEFVYRYVTDVLDDAKIYSSHANRKSIDADDIKLAVQMKMDHSFTSPPPKDLLMEIARQKNSQPLPLVKPYCGPRLPPDRYCLSAPNYKLRTMKKPRNVQYGLHMGQRVGIGSQVKSVASPSLTVVSKSLAQPTVTILNKPKPAAPKPIIQINPGIGSISGMTRIITPTATIGNIAPISSVPSTLSSATTFSTIVNPLKRKLEDDDYDN